MNKVFLKGRLTNEPELRQTPSGVSVSKFTIAVNRRFDREKTDFINCEAWRNTAEFISKYFTKGKEIAIIGQALLFGMLHFYTLQKIYATILGILFGTVKEKQGIKATMWMHMTVNFIGWFMGCLINY